MVKDDPRKIVVRCRNYHRLNSDYDEKCHIENPITKYFMSRISWLKVRFHPPPRVIPT